MEISLALGGGGIKGIAHIGVLECLIKAGFKIGAIAGTSAGGMVGAVYAAGYRPDQILAAIDNLKQDRIYARGPNDGPSLLGYTGLAEVLTDLLGETNFSDLKIPFACTAVDLKTSQEVYLGRGCVMDAILATIAVPGIFPPKISSDLELIDGGILDPVPVNLARRMAPHLPVVAVVLTPERDKWDQVKQFPVVPPVPLPIPTPLIEGISRMRIARAFHIFIQAMDVTARMMTELQLEVDKPEVIIRPEVHQYALLDVALPRELVDYGYQAAERAVPEIRRTLSWSNTLLRKFRQAGIFQKSASADGPPVSQGMSKGP